MIENMKNNIAFLLLVFTSFVFAKQDKYLKHTVSQGETITQIAQKYKVTPFDIYKLNPDSQKGIQLNSVLLIPSNGNSVITSQVKTQVLPTRKATTHLVLPKETLFSLSRMYNVSVDEIKNANVELLKNGLKIGQNVVIPASDGTSAFFNITSARI